MDGGIPDDESLVDQAVTKPSLLLITRLRQRNRLTDEASKGIGLRKRLTIELIDPLRRTVGGDHHQWSVLVIRLCDSRSKVEQSRATGDTDCDG